MRVPALGGCGWDSRNSSTGRPGPSSRVPAAGPWWWAAWAKYAGIEIERRWLFDLERCPRFDERAGARITDRYVSESALRLRKVEYPTGEVTYKFCKKYDRIAPLGQPIVNIYLSSGEF